MLLLLQIYTFIFKYKLFDLHNKYLIKSTSITTTAMADNILYLLIVFIVLNPVPLFGFNFSTIALWFVEYDYPESSYFNVKPKWSDGNKIEQPGIF